MSQRVYRIIVNPASGRGAGARARPIIERVLGKAGVAYELTQTSGHGEARQLAHEAMLRGYEVIVAVGGDGTAHEVVNGMVQAAQSRGQWASGEPIGALGIVPLGTGNDYAWRLGLPEHNPELACHTLLADQRRVVDLGQVTDELGNIVIFHNHLGGAFEGATNLESRKIQRLHGLLLYLVAVLRVIPRYTKAPLITVRYNNGEQTRPLLLASVANGGRSGGGFKMSPGALLDDGQLDLVLADSPHPLVTLYLLPHFLAGTHLSQKRFVSLDRTSHVVIEAAAGIPIHLDGESFRADARRLDIAVLPKRLTVIAGSAR